MAEPTDMARMAQQFLELWQREVTRQMSDPAVVSAMLTAMQAFARTPKEPAYDGARRPAPAPDAEHDAVRKLSKRVAELERELAKFKPMARRVEPHGSKPVSSKTKKPARTNKRRVAKRVAKPKRTVRAKKRAAKRGAPKRRR